MVCWLASIIPGILCVLTNRLFLAISPFPLQYEIPRELPIIIANPLGHGDWAKPWSHDPRPGQSEIFQMRVGGKPLFSLPGGYLLVGVRLEAAIAVLWYTPPHPSAGVRRKELSWLEGQSRGERWRALVIFESLVTFVPKASSFPAFPTTSTPPPHHSEKK